MDSTDTPIAAESGHAKGGSWAENVFFLFLSKGVNFLLPVLTIPYITRVVGPEKFGLISFAESFIMYFMLLTDYGFNLSAPRAIAVNREDEERVSSLFSSVMVIKAAFMVVCLMILAALIFLIPRFRADWHVYLLTFGMVVGNVLMPVWFFQGMERMGYIAALNTVSRVVIIASIFLFVKKATHYAYIPAIYSAGSVIAGILGMALVFRTFRIKFRMPRLQEIKGQLKDGYHIFGSQFMSGLYNSSNVFILGLFAGNKAVGYYSGAEKIIKALLAALAPVLHGVYPHISRMALQSKRKAEIFIEKLALWSGAATFSISLALFIFTPVIIRVALGADFGEAVPVLRLLAFLPFIIALSNIFAVEGMLPFGHERLFLRLTVITGIIDIILVFSLVPKLGGKGAALSWLIAEISATIMAFVFLRKVGVNIFKKKRGRTENG